MTTAALKTKLIPLAEVKPYWRNPRVNAESVEAVRTSIERYGYQQPIVVDDDGVIVAGHTRYKALIELGVEKVSVVVASHLTQEQAREYRIADNAAAEASTWDLDALIAELREIPELPEFKPMAPRLDLEALVQGALGSRLHDPTQEEIEAVEQREAVKHSGMAQSHQDDLVDITCPECGETFGIMRSQLLQVVRDGLWQDD